MNWKYKDVDVLSIPVGSYGFVYEIIYSNGYRYIGKKSFYSIETLSALKSGIVREGATRIHKNVKGKRVPYDVIKKESKWKSYTGSCKDPIVKQLKVIRKNILGIYPDKINLTYGEVEHQILNDVLRKDIYLNSNIAGSFYKGKIL